MKFSNVLMPSWLRPSALMMPLVTVCPRRRIADGQHLIAHLGLVGVAHDDHGQLVQLDLDDGQIGVGVGADDLGPAAAAIVSTTSIASAPSTTWLFVGM